MAKCTHKTAVWLFEYDKIRVEQCTYGCGEILVTYTDDVSGISFDVLAQLESIRAENERLRALLKSIEFASWDVCPVCMGAKPNHYDDCKHAAMIKEE